MSGQITTLSSSLPSARVVELHGFGVVVVAEHEVAAYGELYLAALGTLEVEAGASFSVKRVEIYAHALGRGLGSVTPVEFDPDGNGMGMIVAQFLVHTAGKQQRCGQ